MNLSETKVKEMIERMEMLIAHKRMKKKDFYAKSGISSSLYSQWNTGAVKPSLRFISQAADVLEVSPEYLMYGKEKAPTENDGRVTDDDIKFALFGGEGEITDAMYEEVKQFAQMVKMREDAKKKG